MNTKWEIITLWCMHSEANKWIHDWKCTLSVQWMTGSKHADMCTCTQWSNQATRSQWLYKWLTELWCVCACACGGVGHNATFYGNMLCMFCSEFMKVQILPGLLCSLGNPAQWGLSLCQGLRPKLLVKRQTPDPVYSRDNAALTTSKYWENSLQWRN